MIDYGYGVSLCPIDDCQMLREWRNDPQIRRWCREYRLITRNAQNQWMNSLDDRNLMFCIRVEKPYSEQNGTYVGACGLTGIHPVHRAGEFSIYIGLEFQRQGWAEAALKTLFRYGFREANLHRIYGETFEGNPGIKLYKKLDMRFEGQMRQAYFKDGQWLDSYIYSMLADDFSTGE